MTTNNSENKNELPGSGLVKKILFEGHIEALSGLHIGGSNKGMEIGGISSEVIRNPIDQKPYIPGSSLKGKMRSLVELNNGVSSFSKMGKEIEFGPCMDGNEISSQLFGFLSKDDDEKNKKQQPSRLLVRDCKLTNPEELKGTDLQYAQSKTEVVIDRVTAKAMPRTLEQVPAGAKFELKMVLNIFNGDKEAELVQTVFQGLRLLMDDYLGGNGTRGYGHIRINLSSIRERTLHYYLNGHGEGKGPKIPEEFILKSGHPKVEKEAS